MPALVTFSVENQFSMTCDTVQVETVILTTATGYGRDEVRLFVNSLKQSGFTGRAVCFIRPDQELEAFIASAGFEFVRMSNWYVRPIHGLNRLTGRLIRALNYSPNVGTPAWRLLRQLWQIQASRFMHYLEFLNTQRHLGKDSRVVISDCRDVVFFDDPASLSLAGDLVFFEECAKIRDEHHNQRWLRSLYGPRCAQELEENPIVCSGFFAGGYERVVQFLGAMAAEIVRHHEERGFDQGVFNYLVRTEFADRCEVIPHGVGPVIHVGLVGSSELEFDPRGLVRLQGGDWAKVVHQYDRHDDLRKTYEARFKESG